ncbi:hypothetical protein HMPREF0208_01002 [Citrobacter koseri]|uniref:Uncharacterized protein n=1 Tax=Citrobacter koseri (strain ATCC BAA-895 / CDC 4225-83 / SGSC4696) TaxID=290338 RepID=A8AI50_CITK8|nr:hypothetical protein CKO_02037 [Citrobacter koseri ATCC BAA-895]KWZ99413.1 hypothetical protein HMPREF3220_02335 [Citrobacter koseri]KXA04417.1 hypothetical protein HMPREF3207_01402 [Citrobacter koseri]KXB45801.1 hypothetical protein HMPREF0208_01002 [Citrobacter koseri]
MRNLLALIIIIFIGIISITNLEMLAKKAVSAYLNCMLIEVCVIARFFRKGD